MNKDIKDNQLKEENMIDMDVSHLLNNEDLKIIENFLAKDNPFIDFKEMQAIVKMQYDVYIRLMTRFVIH